MDLLNFFGGIIILFLVINLRGRVKKLEQSMGKEGGKNIYEPAIFAQKIETGRNEYSELNDYINQELKKGVRKEEIKKFLLSKGWQESKIKTAFGLSGIKDQAIKSVVVSEEAEPTLSERFIEWAKEDWILKLGAILLLFGFGWLATYAFLNNWIGPMGRITLGIFAGAFFILLGWWRIRKYIHQGGVFLVLGSTTILLTIFAAREVYDFFNPTLALFVMFLSVAFVALASVRYNNRALALTSLILASIAPLLTNSPTANYIGLFSYLLVVVIGTIWVVAITGRRELTGAALIVVVFYSLSHLFSLTLKDREVLLIFAYIFVTIFFLTNIVGILRLKNKKIVYDLIIAAGNGLFLLAWIMVAAQDEWKSLIIVAWMIAFSVAGFLIFKITQRREPFYAYAGVGIAMLATATSIELKGATLTIAYTIESGIIALIVYGILKDIRIAKKASLLLVGPAVLSIASMTSPSWLTGIIHEDFFVLFTLALTFLGLGVFFLYKTEEAEDKESRQISVTLLVTGSFYIYVILWLSLHAGMQNDNIAVMSALVIYTIIGLIFYLYGLANEKKDLHVYGSLLVGFVVWRLLSVDVWKMELEGRIITFFLVGTLLISTAFLRKKKKDDNTKIINT